MYTLSDKGEFNEASVDGLTLTKGGDPVELTDDQVARLKAVGVKVQESGGSDTRLDELSLEALKVMANQRGLPVSGNKADLVERIEDDNNNNEGV